MSLSGQAFHLKKSLLIGKMTVATHLNYFCFDNFLLQLEKVARLTYVLRVFLPVLFEARKILRVTHETLFHSRLSCVMLARIKLWDAPKHNLTRRGAEERDACYA